MTKPLRIVRLQGAIATSGSNPVPFTLPVGFRPAGVVDVPVDLCTSTNGRLQIEPTGVTTVQAEAGKFSNAACFTSLDGVSFAVPSTVTAITLENGWTNAPFGTRAAAALKLSEIVHLEGAIATRQANPVPFVLPTGFRPSTTAFVPVDLCNATNGRLQIHYDGVVTVQAQGGAFSNAACFTSLDGSTFATSFGTFTALTLQNGWHTAPFGTRSPVVKNISNVVTFAGAIATSADNPVAFTLPSDFRPAFAVYVAVDLCSASNGRLNIQPNGVVTVEAESGAFSNAACFTSLDGANFHI